MKVRRFFTLALVALAAPAWGASCGSSPTILPVKDPAKCTLQTVTLSVIASPDLNPTPEGEARPVVVRVYQLKSDVRLQNATFEQIWKSDKDVLADEIVKSDEIAVYPNSRTEAKFERDDSAQYVVGVALFRSPKGKDWFTSFELPPPPSKGNCGVAACQGDNCPEPKPPPDPKFAFWLERTRIDDGADHLGDPAGAGRVRVVRLTGARAGAPAASGSAAGGAAEKGAHAP